MWRTRKKKLSRRGKRRSWVKRKQKERQNERQKERLFRITKQKDVKGKQEQIMMINVSIQEYKNGLEGGWRETFSQREREKKK